MKRFIQTQAVRRAIGALALPLALLLTGVVPVSAQLQTGNLYGTVRDDGGNSLPGVTLTLSGAGAPQTQTTNAEGEFRFLSLGPGAYSLRAELDSYSTVDFPNVVINVARTTEVEVTMNAAVEDVITVTAESPLLDERRISTGNTVTQTELEKVPTARDPWAVLQSTPGVLTDRINVGGNESGQQSQYVGPGSGGDQAVWSVDGVVITDMAALGSSPAYYDFDSFDEMQVTTGGSDSTIATGGVVLNMVTKRGTNEWRGTARYLVADQDWQGDLSISNSELGQGGAWNGNRAQPELKQGNRIVKVEDYGAEIGGPIVKDRLWIWGSYGQQKVDLLTIADLSDYSDLETTNAKINAQVAANNSATASWLDSDKIKLGRNAGPTRAQPTTWNQSKFGDTPTSYKIEDTHLFSSSFYLTGMYSKVNGGFQLVPQGLNSGFAAFYDDAVQFQNNYVLVQTARPQEQVKVDGSTFFNTGNLSHELKFGAGMREAQTDSLSRWGGGGYVVDYIDAAGFPFNVFYATTDGRANSKVDYDSLYVQDTIAKGNLTLSAGLRYDVQTPELLGSRTEANPILPDLLPAVTVGGADAGFEWKSIVPRLGLTYAIGQERRTLLRASFSRFADQLGAGAGSWLHAQYPYRYMYFATTNLGSTPMTRGQILDLNGDGVITPADSLGAGPTTHPVTGLGLQSDGVASGLDPQMTDELLFSVEHALRPEFVVGVNLTYRQITDILELENLVFDGNAYSAANLNSIGRLHRRSDYEPVTVTRNPGFPDGTPYTYTYYRLKSGVTSRGGQFLENGDREQEYVGVSLTFNKRLANRWMMRGNFSWSDWKWNVPDSENEDLTTFLGGGYADGDIVMQGSGTGSGPKGAIYINSTWSYALNGLYQVAPDRPWGFNVSANLTGREGYPLPYFERLNFGVRGFPGFTRVQVVGNESDRFRLDDIHTVDARIEKEFQFNEFGMTVGIDAFNLLNENTILQRNHRLRTAGSARAGTPGGDWVTEVLSPQIFRLGVRFSLR